MNSHDAVTSGSYVFPDVYKFHPEYTFEHVSTRNIVNDHMQK